MKLAYRTFDLPLHHTFTISRESIDVQPTLIVELSQGSHTGYGEATSNDFYGVTLERMIQEIESLRSVIERHTLDDPAQLWKVLHEQLPDGPFSLCALDQAAHDLWGKLRGKPVHELWGLNTAQLPLTNFTIGLDRIEVMIDKMKVWPAWPVFKIKLGGNQDDVEIVRRLRQHTSAIFRVDANCGWTAEQAIEYSHPLKDLGVEFIEQPLPIDEWESMRRVREESVLPVLADESCQVPSDVAKCEGFFDGVNIKLTKCGGLTPARRMIQDARQRNMKVMVGCMTESTVGISAIAQLLPLLDFVDMDGALLLSRDIATGVTIENGVCRYADENGCGVQLMSQDFT